MKETNPREHTIIRRRGGGVPSGVRTDNYIAARGSDHGNRKGAGAPKGNRNALRHGRRSALHAERRRLLKTVCRRTSEISTLIGTMLAAGVNPGAHEDLIIALSREATLSLRKFQAARIAKPPAIHQDHGEVRPQDAARREQAHEIHLVQPDAVAVPAGRFPGEEPLGLGRHRPEAVRPGEEP
jgi:hypothetical protein